MAVYSVRTEMAPLSRRIILALAEEKVLNEKVLEGIRKRITKEQGGVLPKNLELIQAYYELIEEGKIAQKPGLLEIIQKRKVRTLSGIANITVLTKNWGCPGQCIFCPAEKDMPKSYLSNEPAMMRAVRNDFDAYKQVKTRLNGLLAQGHDVTKIDVRIAGGTWSAIPKKYQEEFIKGIYFALNEGAGELTPNFQFSIFNFQLGDLIKQNETAKCRCVGLWIETRPDWVDEKEVERLRSYGVTGVELGVQTTDDAVNAFCKRGHGLKESIRATQLCRDAGLKICHHLMPNLPTATRRSDLKSGRDLFRLEGLRPDYLKIYPCVVMPFSELETLYKKDPSIYTPYTDEELMEMIIKIKKNIPEYCRVIRVIRDIPADSIVAGSKVSNLRQEIQKQGVVCRCIRCREIKDTKFKIKNLKLKIFKYKTKGGKEIFLHFEEPKLNKIVAILRLRLPDHARPEGAIGPAPGGRLQGVALVRELHVYGRQKTLGNDGGSVSSKTQHLGLGKRLMIEAERLAAKAGYSKVAVIAAVGTREYYKKLGYKLEGTYMVKTL